VTDPAPLRALLAKAPFPLFGIPPSSWEGPCFVGTVRRLEERIEALQFVYLDELDEGSMGICVSNLDAAALAAGRLTPLETHLVGFISRFDDAFLLSRVKRRRFEPFPTEDIAERSLTITLASRTVGANLYTHRTLPLQLVRAPVRIGKSVTDVGVAGWRLDPVEFASRIVPVDPAFADAMDAANRRVVRLELSEEEGDAE
jgi:hypothetical protein